MAIFHFHITDFHCSVCGKLVEPNKVKLAYISKKRTDADDRGRILLQKNVLKAVFPNLKLFEPTQHFELANDSLIVYGILIVHIDCDFKLEPWMEYLLGYELAITLRTGIGFASSLPLEDSLDGAIDMECVICGKKINTLEGDECYLSMWDEEEFVFCSEKCLSLEIM